MGGDNVGGLGGRDDSGGEVEGPYGNVGGPGGRDDGGGGVGGACGNVGGPGERDDGGGGVGGRGGGVRGGDITGFLFFLLIFLALLFRALGLALHGELRDAVSTLSSKTSLPSLE